MWSLCVVVSLCGMKFGFSHSMLVSKKLDCFYMVASRTSVLATKGEVALSFIIQSQKSYSAISAISTIKELQKPTQFIGEGTFSIRKGSYLQSTSYEEKIGEPKISFLLVLSLPLSFQDDEISLKTLWVSCVPIYNPLY